MAAFMFSIQMWIEQWVGEPSQHVFQHHVHFSSTVEKLWTWMQQLVGSAPYAHHRFIYCIVWVTIVMCDPEC